jgi:hypothetical protein
MEITALYCKLDDVIQEYEREIRLNQIGKQNRRNRLSTSEVITILVDFQGSGYKDFKEYYTKHVCIFLRKAFPKLVSYNRFTELMRSAIFPMFYYLHKFTEKEEAGIYYIDSTS